MLKKLIFCKHYRIQKGMASMEAMASIVLYLAFLSFSLGFFGVVHSGIMNSLAARTYAFDTFNNRTYLKYHRDKDSGGSLHSHKENGFRVHTIVTEGSGSNNENFIVTERRIAFAGMHDEKGKGNNLHLEMTEEARDNSEIDLKKYSFNPVWIKAAYGICLNARCRP